MLRIISLAIAVVLLISNCGWSETKLAPVSISDMMAVKHLQDLQLSPDGRQIALVVAAPDFKSNVYRFELSLVDAATGERHSVGVGPNDPAPCWSPDSQRLAFFTRTPKAMSIRLFDTTTKKIDQRSITVPNDSSSLAWSPRGDSLAMLAPRPLEKSGVRRFIDTVEEGADAKNDELLLCDLESGVVQSLLQVAGHVANFSWSPDGTQIAYTRQSTAGVRYSNETDLWLVTIASGESTALVKRPGGDTRPKWSPDGNQIAFISQGGQKGFFHPYLLVVMAVAGGEARSLTDKLDVSLSPVHSDSHAWSADGRTLYFPVEKDFTRQLYQMDAESTQAEPITSGECTHRDFSFAADGSRVAFAIDSPSMPADLYVSDVSQFEPQRLVELNAELNERRLGKASIFHWKSKDGTPVEGLLVVPADFEEGSPVPLVTWLHGGPAGNFLAAFAPEVWFTAPQVGFCPIHVLTGRGYAVLCPNPRGSDGYGKEFREANIGAWGEDDLDDVLTGIDELVRLGIADPERLSVTGYCYGAYLALRALTRTERFETAILGAYFGDLAAVYGQTDIPNLFSAYFGGPPWENRADYDRCSPMHDAHQIKTPVLMLHAKNDQRIPWTQSKQLHTILEEAGTTAELISYPRGKHTVFEPRMHAETMRQTVVWHDRWLNPQ